MPCVLLFFFFGSQTWCYQLIETEVNKPLIWRFILIWLAAELCLTLVVAYSYQRLQIPSVCLCLLSQLQVRFIIHVWEPVSCSSFGCNPLLISWRANSVMVRWEVGGGWLVQLSNWASVFQWACVSGLGPHKVSVQLYSSHTISPYCPLPSLISSLFVWSPDPCWLFPPSVEIWSLERRNPLP